MAPSLLPSSEIRLDYPLYALDFDPQDANRLVVGGGGGPGRSGVSNKISVLDASHQDALQVVSEVTLSRDEDSVTALAVGPRRKNSIVVYAGINSSQADIQKGKNEHFRALAVDQPSKTKAPARAKITELSRSALFSSKDPEAYQRLLRITPPVAGQPQVGAIATGLAKDAQIVLFDIPSTGTATSKARGTLELVKEAMDIEILQTGEDEWQLLYCDELEIFTVNIKKGSADAPRLIYTMPLDVTTGQAARPTLRSIRYLTSDFILAAANMPKAGGVLLYGFRLPAEKLGPEGKANLAISLRMPRGVTRATGMAVRNLSPPASLLVKQGDSQFVVAVAGHDSSITLYTLDHQTVGNINLIANLHIITTLKTVHPGPISGLAFSHFLAPKAVTMRVHHLKLASIGSMGNTCVVHSIPLKKLKEKSASARRGAGPPRTPRYVVALKSHGPSAAGLLFFTMFFGLLVCLVAQGLLEIKGLSGPVVYAKSYTPARWHADWKRRHPAETATAVIPPPSEETTPAFLADYLAGNQLSAEDKVVLLSVDEAGSGVKLDKHNSEQHGLAHEWDALPPAQKNAWKRALKKAGHWGEETGEAIFKGILFGEIGGAVGQMVAG
ncbi:hypothetical protein B0H63DRAFT_481954 [Podospora didyma]|uniref:Guanine nucleotide-exchange factor SEC12 n=1 Tax=Podospora didyma TaxID=330526 RepID=A0AAE0KEF1_9PEZI|nr:hypothetical protein B0H63DRAFT_481954 [Podospora didyma]